MTSVAAVMLLGFFLGVRHSSDADHVIAVATIVSRERRLWAAALIGILWGLGHTVTILVVGGAIILFSVVIPPRIGLAMEFSVALMLILLGVMNVTGILRWISETVGAARSEGGVVHSHPHSHGDYVHTHPHGHGPDEHDHGDDETWQSRLDRTFGRLGPYQFLRPLIVGVVHGLAGSAAVALLVLATIQNPLWAIAYLVVFGVGTVAGMMLITLAIGLPFVSTGNRFPRFNRYMGLASGLISLAFGLWLVYKIGIVDGLFTSHPSWKPE